MSSRPVAVITGTTHGIGTVTSRELAAAGYHVLMLCRNLPSARVLAQSLSQQFAGSAVEAIACDLSDFDSVRRAAHEIRQRGLTVDRLINNAGIVSTRRRRCAQGLELTFATNHLGPFLLTRLLLPVFAPQARIINVSSKVHYKGRMDLDSIEDPRARYGAMAAYARSKLANVLDTLTLARQLGGSGTTVNCLHPGVVATHLLPGWLNLIRPLFKRLILTPEQGARTSLYLALDPAGARLNGVYLDEYQRVQPVAPLALDPLVQQALLTRSSRWTGLDQAGP